MRLSSRVFCLHRLSRRFFEERDVKPAVDWGVLPACIERGSVLAVVSHAKPSRNEARPLPVSHILRNASEGGTNKREKNDLLLKYNAIIRTGRNCSVRNVVRNVLVSSSSNVRVQIVPAWCAGSATCGVFGTAVFQKVSPGFVVRNVSYRLPCVFLKTSSAVVIYRVMIFVKQ